MECPWTPLWVHGCEDFFRHYFGPRPRLVQKALPGLQGLEEDGVAQKAKTSVAAASQ